MREPGISVIFLVGAVFVSLGIFIQSRLLTGLQTTLSGLVSICLKCKKINTDNQKPREQEAWTTLESYISSKSDVNFSHGHCPSCYREVMEEFHLPTD